MPLAEPTTGTENKTDQETALEPLWNVVLLDDDDHTYDYVVEMLCRLFFKTLEEAYRHAVEVDSTGRTIVLTCERGAAEFARDQIHGFGRDWRMPKCKGSMTAVIEPATGG
jgi:ATP-dependent Clp protease adaptor protein ClpS